MVRLILLALVAVSALLGGASATKAQTVPFSPAATATAVARGVPLHVLAAQGNPNVTVERIDLSPAACARLLAGVPPSLLAQVRAQQCSLLHYSFGYHAATSPLPAASPAGSVPPGYIYWQWSDEISDILGGAVWSVTMWEDGIADGQNVYRWGNSPYCTPAGVGVKIDPNGCFYLFNGGGPPVYGMQFGSNFCTGITTLWVTVCYEHGMRRWIDDYGDPSTFFAW